MTILAAAPPGRTVIADEGPLPLSVAQEALWYQSVMHPQEIIYNETVSFRHTGPVDPVALARALEEVILRHEIWRTTFDVVGGEPVQVVGPVPVIHLPVLDLSELSPADAEARAVQVIAEVSRVPYDLRRGPLLRPRLMRLPGGDDRLYLAIHHMIFDGVSIYRTVLPELGALHDAFASGMDSPLAAPSQQYGSYARWEQELLHQPRSQRRLAWWHQRLAEASVLAMPTDRPRLDDARHHGAVQPWDLEAARVQRLRQFAVAEGCTLFQALGAIWATVLQRWSGQSDVAFGTAADLRQRPELEGMLGYCLTPMVVRVELDGRATLRQAVHRVRDAVLDGLDHLVPFERIVRALNPAGHPGANPVYQTMLVLEPPAAPHDERWSLHQMEGEIGNAVGSTRMDLELELDERPDGHLAARVIFDVDLYDRETVIRLLGHFEHVVEAMCDAPDTEIGAVALVDADERDRQLAGCNATTLDVAEPITVAQALTAQRDRDPSAPALELGGLTFQRAGLPERASTIAALHGALDAGSLAADAGLSLALAAELGLGPADTVLLLPQTLREHPAAGLWPALCAGARTVLADETTAASGAQVSRLVRGCGATLLIASPAQWRALIDTGLKARRGLRALVTPARIDDELARELLMRCRVVFCAHGADASCGPATFGRLEALAPLTIGGPLPGCRARVLDEHEQPLSAGLVGELELTTASGTVRSGERARWLADGRLQLV